MEQEGGLPLPPSLGFRPSPNRKLEQSDATTSWIHKYIMMGLLATKTQTLRQATSLVPKRTLSFFHTYSNISLSSLNLPPREKERKEERKKERKKGKLNIFSTNLIHLLYSLQPQQAPSC